MGFLVSSTLWKRRLWAKPSLPALGRELRKIYLDALPDDALRERLSVWEREGGVTAVWHPAEEGLSIDLQADGSLTAWAKTNTVGPGYHAFLVDLLERIATQWGVRWRWEDVDEDHSGDETGYAIARDPVRLQDQMAIWLHSVAEVLFEHEGAENLFVSMAIGPLPRFQGFVGSPTGIWSEPQFRRIADDVIEAYAAAPAFFPWWTPGFGADFWNGMARVGVWCDVNWVGPRDQNERDTLRRVLDYDRRALALDPAHALDPALRDELGWLLERGTEIELPHREGPGYKRLPTRHRLFGGPWSVELPGHFIEHVLNDGNNLQYVGDRRAVYVSSLTINAADASLPPAAELLDTANRGERSDLSWSQDAILASARWEDDAEDSVRHLYAAFAVDGHLLLLTISNELEASPDWAESVARSVRRPE
ncbi:MAG: hypothetical protein ACREP7_08235 [Lysobacter sp.]